jgi:hypothetical protein
MKSLFFTWFLFVLPITLAIENPFGRLGPYLALVATLFLPALFLATLFPDPFSEGWEPWWSRWDK